MGCCGTGSTFGACWMVLVLSVGAFSLLIVIDFSCWDGAGAWLDTGVAVLVFVGQQGSSWHGIQGLHGLTTLTTLKHGTDGHFCNAGWALRKLF